MSRFVRRALAVLALLLLPSLAHAFTLVEKNQPYYINVTTNPSSLPPITDVYLYEAYSDPAGALAHNLVALPAVQRGGTNNILIGLLLPAVRSNEHASLVGFCDGSVLVGITDGTSNTFMSNPNFDFQSTFGTPEATLAAALQNGDTNSIIAVLDQAYSQNYLPSLGPDAPATGQFLSFSSPTSAGTFSISLPEPSLALLAPPLLLLLRRRRASSHFA